MSVQSQPSKLDLELQEAYVHHKAGRLPEAEKLYRRILRTRPSHPDANNALGYALKDQGKMDEALAAFRRVAAVSPNSAAAHNNLGTILFSLDKLEEAEASYRRALAIEPNMIDAIKNLGLVIVDLGRSGESVELFRKHARMAYGTRGAQPAEPVPPHKQKHDQEQFEFLKASGPVYNLEEGARLPGRIVNPDTAGIAEKWATSSPQFVVIDNLLTPEALEALRQFCWRSTIWHRAHRNGYVGAMPEHGFACPLLTQIDEELRATYPTILGPHPLLRWWGFKYDSQLRGINVHADFAAVNINFWIAPEGANRDPESGGLVIWDKIAPLDWGFKQYNGAPSEAIRDFLQKEGAKAVTVPHRPNRAVVFDSDLFHETDKIVFNEGYTNRRINITMLYGKRGEIKKPN